MIRDGEADGVPPTEGQTLNREKTGAQSDQVQALISARRSSFGVLA